MTRRSAIDLAAVGTVSSAAYVAYQGGWAPFTSAAVLLWLAPSTIGSAVAGGLARPLGERLGRARWIVPPVAVGWPFLVGWLAGWRPVYCAGWGPLVGALLLVPIGHLGWCVPLAHHMERGGWRRWALMLLLGLPFGFCLWHAYGVGWGTWWHGEFACGGGGGG
jgi:hypothetical protein